MVCPKCKIMTQRIRRGHLLEHVCRYPGCKGHGQVVARVPIPEPVVEDEGNDTSSATLDSVTPSPQGEGLEAAESGETTDE